MCFGRIGYRTRKLPASGHCVNQVGLRRGQACRTPVRGHCLRDEMKEHRRLQKDRVLQAGQFETARALILKAHE